MKSERVAVGDHEITKRQRYHEIVAVLARHGFGVVDDRMLKHETKEQARAEHLRLACEELGTLFIKLGQMLSTRSDILPGLRVAWKARQRLPRLLARDTQVGGYAGGLVWANPRARLD